MSNLLNEQPRQYVPIALNLEDSFGLLGSIKSFYRVHLDMGAPYGKILTDEGSVTIPVECIAMLKAILCAGCCKIEERAEACRKAFDACVLSESKEEFLSNLEAINQDDPWVNEIYKAVKELW